MRKWRTVAVVATLLAAGLAVPVAWAVTDDDDGLPRLPRPSREQAQPTPAVTAVVRLKEGAATTAITSRGAEVLGDIPGTGYLRVRPGNGDTAALVTRLLDDPTVEEAAPDYARTMQRTPNDPYYPPLQSPYLNTIRMPEAWDRVADASGQVIAVIDTGVDATHPDLAGRVLPGYNAVYPGASASDIDGHGTFVAGIVAASPNNSRGIAGIAWNASILPVQVFTRVDNEIVAYDSDVAEGIVWAVDHDATVVNLSLAGPGLSPILHAAVRYALDNDVVVVAAAGNTGANLAEYPAAFTEVIAVGATDNAGRLVDFSTWGDWLDLAAPGFGILSTYGDDYYVGDGTSFAAPMVAGVAALVRAQNPHLNATDIAGRLRATARDAGPRGIDPHYGHGLLDAARALGASFAADLPLPTLGAGEPNDTPAQATAVTGSAQGRLNLEGDLDWYRYNTATAQTISVTVTPAAFDGSLGQNADPVVEVYDKDLRRLGWADSRAAGGAETVTVWVPAGNVYVRVSNYNGSGDGRTYTVGVGQASAPLSWQVADVPIPVDPATSLVQCVVTGDVTGDGRLDVVVGTTNYTANPMIFAAVVLPGLPGGGLGSPVVYELGGRPEQLLILDIDKDGRNDVGAVRYAYGGVEGLLQQDDGTLATAGLVPGTELGWNNAFAAGDVDGDGDADLVAVGLDIYDPDLTLLTHGSGDSFTATVIDTNGDPFWPITAITQPVIGDVTGDGRNDIVLVPRENGSVSVYENLASGWVKRTYAEPGYAWSLGVGDVTGDAAADVVLGHNPDVLVRAQSNGVLAPKTTYASVTTIGTTRSLAIADVDQDGLNDVITLSREAGAVILRQRADHKLGQPELVPLDLDLSVTNGYQGIAVADLSGDGRAEVIVGGSPLHVIGLDAGPGPRELVSAVQPVNGYAQQPTSAPVKVTFTTGLAPSTVNDATVYLRDGRTGATVPASLAYDAGTRTATLTPTDPLHKNKPYRVVVDGVATAAGDHQLRPFSSTFVTANAGSLPAIGGLWMHGIAGATVRVDQMTVPAGDIAEVIIRAAAGTTAPASLTAGAIGYRGVDPSPVLVGFTPNTTYAFGLWYRDRAGNLSPRSTVVLLASSVTMELTSGTSTVKTTDTLRFATTVTGPADDPNQAMRPITLSALCRGGATSWRPVETTVVWGQPGTLMSAVQTIQTRPDCTYRWEFEVDAFMGAVSPTVRVTATIALPGSPPPRDH